MRILEVTNCRMVALDRDEWAQLVKKARAPQKGFRANDDDDVDVTILLTLLILISYFRHKPLVTKQMSFCILRSTLCSVYSFPTSILRLPCLRVFRAFSSVVKQMPGYTSQRWGTVRTLPN